MGACHIHKLTGATEYIRADLAAPDLAELVEALTNLPAIYTHQINTGVREVYDPLQRFYTMESVLAALATVSKTHQIKESTP